MLIFDKGNAAQSMILTLTEKSTLQLPTYRMACTHVTTKNEVLFELGTDYSAHLERYNEFTVDILTLFATQQRGQWNYICYENTTNVEVENGKMILNEDINFSYTGYNEQTNYTGYSG
jgi:hypothetical protein